MRRIAGPPRWGLIATVLVVGGFSAPILIGHPTRVEWFTAVDDDTIRIGVIGGGNGTWTRVRDVVESDEAVTIAVRTVNHPQPQTALGHPLELTIDLSGPLADRAVVDGSTGNPVQRAKCPDPFAGC